MPVIRYIPHIRGTTGRIAWWVEHRKDAVRRLSNISSVTSVVRTCSLVIETFLLKQGNLPRHIESLLKMSIYNLIKDA